MERKLLRNNWNEMRWQIGEWWDELTDEDLDRINGDQDRLITVLQERYGYTRNLAFVEVNIRLADYRPDAQERSERHSNKNDVKKATEYSIYDFDDWLESSNAKAARAKAHTHLEVAQQE